MNPEEKKYHHPMPKTALISDIHANIDALEAVLTAIDQQGIKEILCLGDIVGYGAAPAECVKLVRERCSVTLMGNHDEYLVKNPDKFVLSRRIRDPLVLAKETVPKSDVKWLSKLPFTAEVHGFTIVHASLHHPESFNYLIDRLDALQHFAEQKTPLCFVGHTHSPVVTQSLPDEDVRTVPLRDSDNLLDRTQHYAINVGSVGQPRDGNPRAAYGIYNPEDHSFTLRRVSYDIQKAADRIRKAGLPEENASRLFGSE
jgi:diadenosine tetraphosphatase ApaH/serine/threonine PP2A family protein phosphatase